MDKLLAVYWTPPGMPLWKHHLPAILIAVVMLSASVLIGFIHYNAIFIGFGVILLSRFTFAYLARSKWGNTPPPGSSYESNSED